MTSLDSRRQGSSYCSFAQSSGSTGPYIPDSHSIIDTGSAISDSLQLAKFEEEDSMISHSALPQAESAPSSSYRTLRAPSIGEEHDVQQQTETPPQEETRLATGTQYQEAMSTQDYKRHPRFRSGRLRFRLPKRHQADVEIPPTRYDIASKRFRFCFLIPHDADPCSTLQDRSSERRSSSPELPDLRELLRDSAVDNARSGSSDSEESVTSAPDAVEVVLMRIEPHDKPRRLFALPSSGILSVTMRGSCDLVERAPLRRTALRTVVGGEESRQLVDDACILHHPQGDLVCLGRVSDTQQLSIVRIRGKVVRITQVSLAVALCQTDIQ